MNHGVYIHYFLPDLDYHPVQCMEGGNVLINGVQCQG